MMAGWTRGTGKLAESDPKTLEGYVTTSGAKWSPRQSGDGVASLAMTVSTRKKCTWRGGFTHNDVGNHNGQLPLTSPASPNQSHRAPG
jgi:hypothetical protein